MDRRRALIGIVTVTSLAAIGSNGALGQPRTVRIGLLAGRPDSNYVPGILYKLSELGYRGSTVVVLQRSSDGAVERYPALARELVESKCDVIFAIGDQAAARAARDSALNVPVVFLAVDYDPVQKGIVRNLTRPGGSVTGVYVPQGDLVAKRLEILHELVLQAKRFLVLSDIFSIDQSYSTPLPAEMGEGLLM